MTAIPLRIYSDFLCPYCYLAEKQLDRLRGDYEIKTTWIGFELHPEIPPAGLRAGALGSASFAGLWKQVEQSAQEYGIEIRPPAIMPNTHLALEAVLELGDTPVGEKFRGRVFDALFLENRDIGSQSVLLDIAGQCGADVAKLRQALDERVHFDKVEENREAGYDELVTGVPTILVGGMRALGVQPLDVYRGLFDRSAGLKPD